MQDDFKLSQHVDSAMTEVNSLNMLTVQSNDCGASQAESVIYDGKKLKKKNQ